MVSTYLTKDQFDQGCRFTGELQSWCASADGLRDVLPGTEPGNARYLIREKRDAKATAIIGRDHTDLPACANHMFNLVGCDAESGRMTVADGFEVFKLDDIVFADA